MYVYLHGSCVENHCRSVVSLKEQNDYSRGCSVIYMRDWNFKEKHMLERGLIKIKNAINLGFYCWLDTILWFLNDLTWRVGFLFVFVRNEMQNCYNFIEKINKLINEWLL